MINGYRIVQIPNMQDSRGSLAFVEFGQLLDFEIRRVYWLYNVDGSRGFHAHKTLKQFIFCVNGSVDIVLDDGNQKTTVILDSPTKGLIISKPLWREMNDFKKNATLIILASDIYQETDYIRSYEEFRKWKLNF